MPTITAAQIENYVTKLRSFVEREHEEGQADLAKRWEGPLEERVAKGNAIANLTVVEIERLSGDKGTRVLASCISNDARYREGDCVKLTLDNPKDSSAVLASGRIVVASDTEIELICDRCRLEPGQSDLTLDASSIDLRQFYDSALTQVAASAAGRERIIPLLLGLIEPSGASFEELADIPRLQPTLNGAQAEAVVRSAATDLCHLVQGPPGTGKTQVLAALVRRLLEKKPNAAILITSFTHRAIDNALSRVVKAGVGNGFLYKVGSVSTATNVNHVHNARDIDGAKDGGPLIIGATPFALKYRATGIEFDWVIVDEASQMTLPLAVMAMNAGRRWIFFGDDQQMPPVVLSVPPAEAVRQSVFGVLKRGGYDTMLEVTYRLPTPLADWPSREFYGEKLISAPKTAGRRLQLPSIPSGFEQVLSSDPAAVFIPLDHSDSTTASIVEVDAIVKIVTALRGVGFPLSGIGVVVPYRRQARLLRKRLQASGLSASDMEAIIADTVERMQGQERGIIILSLTTSSVSFAAQVADFLFQPQRLNVAITRPEKKLIVVGSTEWQRRIPSEIPAADLVSRFLKSCATAFLPV